MNLKLEEFFILILYELDDGLILRNIMNLESTQAQKSSQAISSSLQLNPEY